jgi:hypothetical protein
VQAELLTQIDAIIVAGGGVWWRYYRLKILHGDERAARDHKGKRKQKRSEPNPTVVRNVGTNAIGDEVQAE